MHCCNCLWVTISLLQLSLSNYFTVSIVTVTFLNFNVVGCRCCNTMIVWIPESCSVERTIPTLDYDLSAFLLHWLWFVTLSAISQMICNFSWIILFSSWIDNWLFIHVWNWIDWMKWMLEGFLSALSTADVVVMCVWFLTN